MKHVVSFSGGLGSYLAAKRVVEAKGKENTYLLFTDTLTEDEDLYRFLIDTALNIYELENDELKALSKQVPLLEEGEGSEDKRRDFLLDLAKKTAELMPNFIWLIEGHTVWEIFKNNRIMGNSLYDPCSDKLKRKVSNKYIKKNFDPKETIVYMGIDWSEKHRFERAEPKFLPFTLKAPMCDAPYLDKMEMREYLETQNIDLPRLYKMGFSHNNCGGFCVKAGLGHFKNLLEKMPERFAYHEGKEQEIRDLLGREDVGFLKKTTKGERRIISLKEFREMEAKQGEQLSLDEQFDFGGCGCFVDDN